MLRSILLALDDTPGALAARDLAFALAREHGARVTALVVLDRPHTLDSHEPVPIGGASFATRRNQALAAQLEAEAASVVEAAHLASAGLAFDVVRRPEAPEAALLAEGAFHDLVVIGRDSTLGREACDDGLSPTIEALVRDGARPLLVVPPPSLTAGLVPGGPVLMAEAAGLPTQRTLHLFALLGLGRDRPIRVFSMAGNGEALAGYLRAHGLDVQGVTIVQEDGHAQLLDEARRLQAALLVIGAEEEGGLARLVFGSETARLLRASPCPVFIHG